jgi:ribonuclease HII
MNYQAGVDEAGLGPILGPLVVAGVAMAGPEGADPWQRLDSLVCRARHERGKLRVADSKKVKQGPHGLQRLEATALAFWTAWQGSLPATVGEFLQALPVPVDSLVDYPWYADLTLPLPRHNDRDALLLQAELLARALRKAELQLLGLAIRPVEVVEWNALIAATDNKSRAHFHAYAEVLGRVLAWLPAQFAAGERGQLVADRCGGRMHYAQDLRQLWSHGDVQVLTETPASSTYLLQRPSGAVQLTFTEKGEDRAFPTALASCLAKYVRELLVELLNRWFTSRVDGLQPTAGYYTDGHRFLADLHPHLERLAVPTERLVRSR